MTERRAQISCSMQGRPKQDVQRECLSTEQAKFHQTWKPQ